LKTLSVVLALVGLALGTVLVAWFGFAEVFAATLAAGWGGFAVLSAWQMGLFAVLGASWDVIAPAREGGRSRMGNYLLYVWGRMVRDSVGNCLPFTHMGGFVAGVRAVSLHGVPATQATASTVADVTAEVLAQIIFAALGLVILVAHAPDSRIAVPVAVGLAIALPALGAFVLAQKGAASIFGRLSGRIAGEWFPNAQERVAVLQAEFGLIYGHTPRLVACILIHLLAWIGTGIGGWIAFRLLGADISLIDAIAIEGLLHAVLAIAFFVPGHAGVQEAAYVGLGAAFGISPEVALGASLLRRARDLAVGIPVLAIWQGLELRALRQRGTRPSNG
jgi:putative membrane protein